MIKKNASYFWERDKTKEFLKIIIALEDSNEIKANGIRRMIELF